MTLIGRRKTFTVAVLLPCAASLWLMTAGETSAITYGLAATLLATMGAAMLSTRQSRSLARVPKS